MEIRRVLNITYNVTQSIIGSKLHYQNQALQYVEGPLDVCVRFQCRPDLTVWPREQLESNLKSPDFGSTARMIREMYQADPSSFDARGPSKQARSLTNSDKKMPRNLIVDMGTRAESNHPKKHCTAKSHFFHVGTMTMSLRV